MNESPLPVPEAEPRSRVEIVSLIVVMIVVLFGGRAVLATLSRFAGVAGAVLFAIALVEGAALVRTLRTASEEARIRASRDAWAFIAALLAVTAVLTRASWAAGAAIASLEFTFVVELLRQLRPQRPLGT